MRQKLTDILWFPVNLVQIVLLLILTACAGAIGLITLALFRDPRRAVLAASHYFWSPLVLGVCLVRFRVRGRENVSKKEQYIYVSNHESQLDIAAITEAVTVPLFFVAKQELAKVPVVGTYMKAMGMIFVDRKNKEKAMASMNRAIDLIRSGQNVITFPEGTRSKTGELLTFKRGSFIIAREGQIGVVPVAIKGTRKVLPSGSFKIRPGRVDVVIGKPVSPDKFLHLSPDETADLFRQKVVELLNQA